MGGWVLEVSKMAIYMAFPVAMFHWFNQPEYFERWVTDTKRQIFPREKQEDRDAIDEVIRKQREKKDMELLKALEEMERREKI
ncbi:protein PET100 homolog, mitochondrial [Toxorhynchites rutilus septentrionalis]|uniref:protein PET100 homolog, mitochondrial n=1 Tax=Toxorhynchites rutilus septentrionalis TaxID=329112 RepID=UPI00247B0286|nr:protein PET100 homolog, mitochondrial [Toxorhynchites rutilus septentrionalis]XP_055629299.1 protein PET100 homolog, mitochondrial [Toxorhynchites rutilus septentrionalis]